MASIAPRWASSDELGGAGHVGRGGGAEFLLGQAELHGQGHQLRLGAVVQVAFDAAQPRGGVVHGAGPGFLQGADPVREGCRAEQAADERPVGCRDGARQPRRREQQGRAERQQHEWVLGQIHGTDAVHPDQEVEVARTVDGAPDREGGAHAPVAHARLLQRGGRGQDMCQQLPPGRKRHEEQAAQPAARGDGQAGHGQRQLEHEVAARPPGGPVPRRAGQPAAVLTRFADHDVTAGYQLGDPGRRQPADPDPAAPLPHPGAFRGGQRGQPGGIGRPHVHVRVRPQRCRAGTSSPSSSPARPRLASPNLRTPGADRPASG